MDQIHRHTCTAAVPAPCPRTAPVQRRRAAPRRALQALVAAVFALPTLAGASSDRALFLEAERALASGDQATFEDRAARLQGYPLAPYLEFIRLERDLGQITARRFNAFAERYGEGPLADRLRGALLTRLAAEESWSDFLALYRPGLGTRLDCERLNALFGTGQSAAALEAARQLWTVGHSQPAACDPGFAIFLRSSAFTVDVARQRAALAREEGNASVVRYVQRWLPADERLRNELWLRARTQAAALLSDEGVAELAAAGPAGADAFAEAIARLARRDAGQALSAWQRHHRRFDLDGAQRRAALDRLGVMLALETDPRAPQVFEQIPSAHASDELRAWRVRWALRQQDWDAVLHWAAELSDEQQQQPQWRYWRARALEARGDTRQAQALYRQAATERDFHGFLAADRIGAPYAFGHRPVQVDAAVREAIESRPGVRRARELLALGRLHPARAEWNAALREAGPDELRAAARIAGDWDWHEQPIFLLARARDWDDVSLRFPVAWRELAEREARANQLDPALVMAIIRRESAFNPQARSPAAARGLMQLIPGTGRRMARALGEPWSLSSLYEPAVNIRYGAHYFAGLLRDLGHPALAAAAYNAGPGRISRWRPRGEALPADIWIETITFGETRAYVAAVLAYALIYQHQLGGQPQRLSTLLPAVQPLLEVGTR